MERVRREREGDTQHRDAPAPPAPVPAAQQILRLQQGAGNAAVARMLAREPADTAPDIDAPAQELAVAQLSELLAHLQDQLSQAQQESARNQIAEAGADRAAAAESAAEPKKRGGVLGALAKPVRRLGSALKKAGDWLGIGGKSKPAAAADTSAADAASASSAAASAEAERKQVAAFIAKLESTMEAEKAKLGELMGSANAATDAVNAAIEPSEREAIVRQQSA